MTFQEEVRNSLTEHLPRLIGIPGLRQEIVDDVAHRVTKDVTPSVMAQFDDSIVIAVEGMCESVVELLRSERSKEEIVKLLLAMKDQAREVWAELGGIKS